MVIRLAVAAVLIVTGIVTASVGLIDILQVVNPYLSVAFGAILVAVGRFVWKNYLRSRQNKTRIDRYGYSIYGDDKDESRPGIVSQMEETEKRVDDIEDRLSSVEATLTRIDEKVLDERR